MKFPLWLSSLLLFAPTIASATIYLAAMDPATHAVGMSVISSGPVVTYRPSPMTGMKGIGFVGWSGSAANVAPAVDQTVFSMMKQSATPEEIETYVDRQIHNKYSRYLFISAIHGTFGHVFPPRGCAEPECGVMADPSNQFIIMGGGLQHDVVPNAMKVYAGLQANPQLPLECKLLLGLQAIINVGGEVREFSEARIGVDRPTLAQQENFRSTAGEAGIIADLRSQMVSLGIQCPVTSNRASTWIKARRDRRSLDL